MAESLAGTEYHHIWGGGRDPAGTVATVCVGSVMRACHDGRLEIVGEVVDGLRLRDAFGVARQDGSELGVWAAGSIMRTRDWAFFESPVFMVNTYVLAVPQLNSAPIG
jgi:hypothetical protein